MVVNKLISSKYAEQRVCIENFDRFKLILQAHFMVTEFINFSSFIIFKYTLKQKAAPLRA